MKHPILLLLFAQKKLARRDRSRVFCTWIDDVHWLAYTMCGGNSRCPLYHLRYGIKFVFRNKVFAVLINGFISILRPCWECMIS